MYYFEYLAATKITLTEEEINILEGPYKPTRILK